jgi:hypothetical protein
LPILNAARKKVVLKKNIVIEKMFFGIGLNQEFIFPEASSANGYIT